MTVGHQRLTQLKINHGYPISIPDILGKDQGPI